MRKRLSLAVGLLLATASLLAQTPATAPQQGPRPMFRGSVNLILVDVNIRDKKGAPIEGLKGSDFEVLENGKVQDIVSFAFEKIAPSAAAATKPSEILTSTTLSTIGDVKGAVPVTIGPKGAKPATPAPPAATPATQAAAEPSAPVKQVDSANGALTSDEVAGHRVWLLLFDTASMQPEDVQKAADGSIKWAKEKMSPSDLVAVASISSSLQIIQDFTNDKAKILSVLQAFAVSDGTAPADVDASTMSTDEATNAATTDTTTVDPSAAELDTFTNDMRLRALKTVCDGLLQFQQHKAILYFSSGMSRSSDNSVESRAAVNACSRSNTSINPVDSRGLQAVVPGGSARQGSRGGAAAFSGRNVTQQFTALAAQQETLQSLAADTGGTAFTDTNDFGEAFDKVEKDISSYYILGYQSSNPKQDGAYRKIEVRLKSKIDAKLTAREGYYADRDFTHTLKTDRETQMQEQLLMAIPATDVPLKVVADYFRLPQAQVQLCGSQFGGFGGAGGPGGGRGGGAPGGGRGGAGRGGAQAAGALGGYQPSCYYVPISLSVPGDAIPPSDTAVTLDIRGYIRDERGQDFAKIKDTLTVPPGSKDSLASKQVLYQTGANLPPGRFTAKIIVRENTTGQMGTFEMPFTVPDLGRTQAVKVSSVVLSTQLQNSGGRKTNSPLVQGNVEIVPNLTRVVTQDQHLYFYYEVYDPSVADSQTQVRTWLSFYRGGKVKVYETSVVERTALDAVDRKAQIFEFDVPADKFKPGVYTCQVNIVDEVSGKFTFPRLDMLVRPTEKAGDKK